MIKQALLLMRVPRDGSFRRVMYFTLMLLGVYLAGCAVKKPVPTSSNVATHVMTLSDHEFSPVNFVPEPGNTIIIKNSSPISHSIYVTYPDGTIVNMGVQTPGTTTRWIIPIEAQGEFVLQCWIHPIIHASLHVNSGTSALPNTSSSSSDSSRVPSQEFLNGRQNICSSRKNRA